MENPLTFKVPDKVVFRFYNRLLEDRRFTKYAFVNGRFFSYRNIVDVEKLAAFFRDHEVTIIVYLRRQDDFAEAYYRQILKRLMPGCRTFKEFLAIPALREWLDYRSALAPWMAHFGKENIKVRLYEQCTKKGGVIADFAALMDLSTDDRFAWPAGDAETNRRLSDSALEFLRVAKANDIPHSLRQRLESWVQENSGRFNDNRTLEYFHGREREQFLDQFKDINAWIAETFLGRTDGRLFEPPVVVNETEMPGRTEDEQAAQLNRLTREFVLFSLGDQGRRVKFKWKLREIKIGLMNRIWSAP